MVVPHLPPLLFGVTSQSAGQEACSRVWLGSETDMNWTERLNVWTVTVDQQVHSNALCMCSLTEKLLGN